MTNLTKYQAKAQQLDEQDPLKAFRQYFSIPEGRLAPHKIYFCNNSLGLPPVKALTLMQDQMQKWASQGVEGWFQGTDNWYASLAASLQKPLAGLLGAQEEEVILMNSLTVNLHLLLVSFYRPTAKRCKIMIDSPTFPSDLYAIKSHLSFHGLKPEEALIIMAPRPGESLLRMEDIQETIAKEGESIALVFLNPVNFLTGQVLEMESIAKAVHEKGGLFGCDLAHAVGNIPLQLHAWEVDFAVGCSYKYLCAGPGGPGIAYVHASHHAEHLPRFSGWWGNDPQSRFRMQLEPDFIPYGGAASWQVSTPSVLALTPLLASLELFQEAGIARLREKSKLQTAFLLELLEELPKGQFHLLTPRHSNERGCQLTLRMPVVAEFFLGQLEEKEIICDFRQPDMIRLAPSPLYNTFSEIYACVSRLLDLLGDLQ
ncbi:kynureninase [Candidatus Protochlamydia phocaeensis]|uniref:kynureninase n=1 Tax=Candidatus Protochlamydia phocaeensis TaxID=1414722 RepID=UPI000838AF12|nr:kynureninase [Candidatus Protochlamydia phocaeensis]